MAKESGKEWIKAPPDGFNSVRFAQRYGLGLDDFEVIQFNDELLVKVTVEIAQRIGKPVFDPPMVLVPKTREEQARDLVDAFLSPNANREALLDKLLKFTGDRPPDVKVMMVAESFTFMFQGEELIIVENLSPTQQLENVQLVVKTAKGKPAKVDGIPVWSSSDESVATVTASKDGMTGHIRAVDGEGGVCQIKVVGDADLGSGVRLISGFLDVTVAPGKGGEAAVFELIPGSPTEQKDGNPVS